MYLVAWKDNNLIQLMTEAELWTLAERLNLEVNIKDDHFTTVIKALQTKGVFLFLPLNEKPFSIWP